MRHPSRGADEGAHFSERHHDGGHSAVQEGSRRLGRGIERAGFPAREGLQLRSVRCEHGDFRKRPGGKGNCRCWIEDNRDVPRMGQLDGARHGVDWRLGHGQQHGGPIQHREAVVHEARVHLTVCPDVHDDGVASVRNHENSPEARSEPFTRPDPAGPDAFCLVKRARHFAEGIFSQAGDQLDACSKSRACNGLVGSFPAIADSESRAMQGFSKLRKPVGLQRNANGKSSDNDDM